MDVLKGDWHHIYQNTSIKILFACEHICFVKQGLICSRSDSQETLEALMNSV